MPALAIVLKGFARTSETFITRELQALEARGMEFELASLRQPQNKTQPNTIRAPVFYLPEYLHHAPWMLLRAWQHARKLPGYAKAKAAFWSDFKRDMSRNRVRRFGQAMILASQLGPQTRHLHAHFIHTPASVARYAAMIRRLTFSVSAHAKDIWTSPSWDLKQKIDAAEFVTVCHARGQAALRSASGPDTADRVCLIPHGVASGQLNLRADKHNPVLSLLSVARAVPKKGLMELLDVLSKLPAEPCWRWTHIGGGPGLDPLRASARKHRYADRLAILGPQPQAAVLEHMQTADVFVLNLRRDSDGDEDGRPNAILEAMQAGLPIVCTNAGSVDELISHGTSGLLPAPDDTEAMARDLVRVMNDATLRKTLGAAAQEKAAMFAAEGEAGYDRLHAMLRSASEGTR